MSDFQRMVAHRPLDERLADATEVWDLAGAVAGKLEIDPDLLATIGELRRPEEKLCVPVDLRALVVSGRAGEAERRGDIATRTGDPGETAGTTLPPPFTDADPLPAGAHLHWAMPDALCRADPEANDDDADLGLPPVPDRWLVVRLGPPRVKRRRAVTAWVIESERGTVTPLERWTDDTEGGASKERLDVTAGGDAAWAAVYDNVTNRFAFHDDLDGAGNGPFTYVVVGWFADPSDDPLAMRRDRPPLSDLLDELGWARAGETSKAVAKRVPGRFDPDRDAIVLPGRKGTITRSTYHGAVFGVRPAGPGRGQDTRPSPQSVTMALGATGATALAALLTTDPEQSDVVAAVVAAATDLLLDPDGGDALASRLHQLAFRSLPGGSVEEWVRELTPPRSGHLPGKVKGVGDVVADLAVTTKSFLQLRDKAKIPNLEGFSVGAVGERSFDVVMSEKRLRIEDMLGSTGEGIGRKPGPVTAGAPIADITVSDQFRPVRRPLPRFFQPADPVVQLQGIGRSQRHGGDGRFDDGGDLLVRTTSQIITAFEEVMTASSVVDPLGHGGLPPEADKLVQEAALLDPTAIEALVERPFAPGRIQKSHAQQLIAAERAATELVMAGVQEVWPLLDHSTRNGVMPSPVALRHWAQPWVPMYIEWEAQLAVTDAVESTWQLGELDLEPGPDEPVVGPLTVAGRSITTPAAARTLADAVDRFLANEDALDQEGRGILTEGDEADLGTLADVTRAADLVTVGLDGLEDRLAGWEHDTAFTAEGEEHAKPAPTAEAVLLRAGAARLSRLRVVDAFGRVLELSDQLARLGVADDLTGPPAAAAAAVTAPAPPVHLRPRITAPARLLVRFVDATDDGTEASLDDRMPETHRNPVAGWLLPDHADDALELFDATGEPIGQLFHRGAAREVTWEGTPGRPGPMGGRPPAAADAPAGFNHLARMADRLLELDAAAREQTPPPEESVLGALLRAVDTTLWTSDPFGTVGLEHPSILTGRPLAVVRATVTLDVPDDTGDHDLPADVATARHAAFAELARRELRVRLGSLVRMDDGLLGWFVDDDYSTFHPVHPAIAQSAPESGPGRGFLSSVDEAAAHGITPRITPISAAYVAGHHELVLRPNQPRRLTLLLHPGLGVHVTSGFLPRKRLDLANQWVAGALGRLLPSFRVGPVLVDPDVVRMPRISATTKSQSWARRPDPGGWRDDPIVAATSTARLPERPSRLEEGWVRIRPDEEA